MSKHTKGPWTVTSPKFPVMSGERVFPAGYTHKIDSSEAWGRVAEVLAHKQYSNKDDPRMEECAANARLIAAAPELKVACEGALAALILGPHVDKQQAIDYLREVLAKVEGDK